MIDARGLVITLAFALATTVNIAAQQARDAAVQVKPGTGVISGVIVAEDDQKPLRGAVVTLNHVDKTYGDTAITDQSGRFGFANLPAGRFVIGADKEGFIAMKAGATRPGRAGIPIALAPGEQRTDVRVALPRGGVITGTVRMPDGQPAAGAMIILQRVIKSEAGRRFVDFHGDIMTDDRGVYRAFGLVDGDYLVQAMPELHFMHSGAAAMMPTSAVDVQWARAQLAAATAANRSQPPPERPLMSMAATYFPNVLQRASAPLVTIGRGEVRAGVDIAVQMLRTYRVSGTLISPSGEFEEMPEVYLVEESAEGFSGMYGASGTNFTFAGVVPGTYTLVATARKQKIYGMTQVTVGDQDIRVTVPMQPGLTMTGKVTFAGKASPPDFGRLRVFLAPASEGVRLEPLPADLKEDGSFSMDGVVPGSYRLMASLHSGAAWSFKSAMHDGRDMSVAPVEISSASAAEPIVVTFTDRPTELTGRLTDALGRAASDYFIVVFSTNERAWFERSRVVTQTRPASDGQFAVRELPPGDYFLAALTDLDRSELYTPAFLRELVPAAIRLTLAEGERKVQNVQIK